MIDPCSDLAVGLSHLSARALAHDPYAQAVLDYIAHLEAQPNFPLLAGEGQGEVPGVRELVLDLGHGWRIEREITGEPQ